MRIAIDHLAVHRAHRADAQRAITYLNEIVLREIAGMSVVRHALESIVKRCDAALLADAPDTSST